MKKKGAKIISQIRQIENFLHSQRISIAMHFQYVLKMHFRMSEIYVNIVQEI